MDGEGWCREWMGMDGAGWEWMIQDVHFPPFLPASLHIFCINDELCRKSGIINQKARQSFVTL